MSNDRNIDLENFCFYCKIIKATRTFHCMICERCVDMFDHHCVYVNNCLGYRNHKYFMLFLFSIMFYILFSTLSEVIEYSLLATSASKGWFTFQTFALIYTVLVNLLISIPLVYYHHSNVLLGSK